MSKSSAQSVVSPARTPEQLAAERLVGIDILRGLAVLAVVMNHTPHYAMGGFRENPWFFPALLMDYGYLGVPLFVLISGFCIHRRAAIKAMTSGDWSFKWVEFWLKRFWRLYPPYLAAIALSITCALFLHDKSPGLSNSIGPDVATHLLMVHNLTADYSGGLGNAAFWSLGMEEQLYAMYFLLLLMMRRKSHTFAIFVAAFTTVAWRFIGSAACRAEPASIIPETFGGLGSWGLWPFSFWLHWALGAIAVGAYFGNCRLPHWCSSLSASIAAAGVGLLTNRLTFDFLMKTSLANTIDLTRWAEYSPRVSNIGELVFAIAFFCLLNWCVLIPRTHFLLRNGVSVGLSWIGKISYSVYLTHLPIIYVLENYLPFGNTPTDWILRMLIYVGTSLVAGAAFYQMVERWFLAGRCPKFWRSSKTVAST